MQMDIIFPLLWGVEEVEAGLGAYDCMMRSLFNEEELVDGARIPVYWELEEDPVDWVVEDVVVVVADVGVVVVTDIATGLFEISSPVKIGVMVFETEDWI